MPLLHWTPSLVRQFGKAILGLAWRFILLIPWIFISLCIYTVIHESGHYIVCNLLGVPIQTFSVGFGPEVLGFTLNGTYFQLNLIPFTGYNMPLYPLQGYEIWRIMIVVLAGSGVAIPIALLHYWRRKLVIRKNFIDFFVHFSVIVSIFNLVPVFADGSIIYQLFGWIFIGGYSESTRTPYLILLFAQTFILSLMFFLWLRLIDKRRTPCSTKTTPSTRS